MRATTTYKKSKNVQQEHNQEKDALLALSTKKGETEPEIIPQKQQGKICAYK